MLSPDKEVAGAGYAVSALCKLGLFAAHNAPGPASVALSVDRVGKGATLHVLRGGYPIDVSVTVGERPAS